MAKYNNNKPTATAEVLIKETENALPLGKRNFFWMIISAVAIIIGFLLMLGKGSTTEFNPDIFSVRRIVIGPAIAFIGFVAMAISIILKPNKKA